LRIVECGFWIADCRFREKSANRQFNQSTIVNPQSANRQLPIANPQ
jgi:hypothetical protein